MKISIYTGHIPSSTFIERLINGIASDKIKVLIHGQIIKNIKYNSSNIKVIGYSDFLSKISISLKYGLLLLFLRPYEFFKTAKVCFEKGNIRLFFHNWAKISPIIWCRPDIFHIQWAKSISYWFFLKTIFGIKILLSLRGTHINSSPLIDGDLSNTYKNLFPGIDQFHAVSKAISKEVQKYRASENRISVIYSGIDIDYLKRYEKENYVTRNTFHILSVGRWNWMKGYNYAIDAVSILNSNNLPIKYSIIANGKVPNEILFQVKQYGLENIISFQKDINQESVYEAMQESDCLLLPSIEEGIANVVLEAMAIGLPVISTKCGGMPEVINNRKNGFLVDSRDAIEISNSIKELMSLEEYKIKKIVKNAKSTISANHSLENYVFEFKDLYKKILNNEKK